ncbi:MAG: nitroreductase [Acidovorax sp.]
MNVTAAVASRRSVRAFLPRPVDLALVRAALEQAGRAPSGGNLQPWHVDVLTGEPLARLNALMQTRLAEEAAGAPRREERAYTVFPDPLPEPWHGRRFAAGEAVYAQLGIARGDKAARAQWLARNFCFFGAPVALFCSVERRMGPPQWAGLGMFLQTLMLLLHAQGVGSCAQEAWALYPQTVNQVLRLPASRMVYCGMAIGYADAGHPVNAVRTERAPLGEWARFHGASGDFGSFS